LGTLELCGQGQQRFFVTEAAEEVRPDGEAVGYPVEGDGHGWEFCEVRDGREGDVSENHLDEFVRWQALVDLAYRHRW
jgi:hypothetical protein